MLELFFTTLTIFGSFEIIFFIPYISHELRFIFIVVQLILCFVLFSNNYYKKHSLWKEQEFQPIHKLPYSPLVNISYRYPDSYSIYYDDFIYIKGSKIYSINQTNDFSKECFQNFFINEFGECPITDIIVEDKQIDSYKDYVEVKVGNYYLYYSNNKKFGAKLFTEKNLTYNLNGNLLSNFKTEFNYITLEIIKKKELNKLSNPLKSLKNYSKFSDFICLTLILFSIYFYWIEPLNDNNFNRIKIANLVLEIITFILYLVRYILFIKVKKFFFENEGIYNIEENNISELSEKYFPKFYFNIDSFPVAISINIFIFYLIHKFFGNKNYLAEYKREEFDENGEGMKSVFKFFCLFSLFTGYLIFFIKNEVSYFQGIKKNINEILYNWNKSPIISIKITDYSTYNFGKFSEKRKKLENIFKINKWKNNYFEIEKLNYVNYVNIYKNIDGKKCGRDSFGNYLYFPESYECPINDIFISDKNKEIKGYEKIYLQNDKYLFYTNNNIEGQIIIDLRISTFNGPQINENKSNEICFEYFDLLYNNSENCTSFRKFNTVPFYKIIDKWNYIEFKKDFIPYLYDSNYSITILNDEYLYLYAIEYQGINSTSIKDRDKINKYSKNFESMDKFHLFKFIISIFYIIYMIAIYFYIMINEDKKKIYILIVIIFFIMILINLIWLIIYIVFIELFLNKINRDFEEKKNTFLWELLILIINISSLLFYLTSFGLSLKCCKKNNNNRNNNRNHNRNNDNNNNRNNNNEILAIRYNINNNEIDSNNRIINQREDVFQNNRRLPPIRRNINESQQLKPIHLCLICSERETQYIFLPCFHKCICEECYNKQKNNLQKCIFCNKPIDSIEKVYEP